MEMSPSALAIIGLVLAVWTVTAGAMMLRAQAQISEARSKSRALQRLSRLVDDGPCVPMLVRTDGRVEAPDRLARWLGLEKTPNYLSELDGGGDRGLSAEQLAQLSEAIARTQKTAASFELVFTPEGGKRALCFRGALADPKVFAGGAALVHLFDFTAWHRRMAQIAAREKRARGDFAALVGVIESAPIPLWFRDTEGRLRLVNHAYARAVGGKSARAVVRDQVELLDTSGPRSPAQIAREVARTHEPFKRVEAATVDGARRRFKVTDLPIGEEGVAGYAIDIEETEELAREFRAFREAQRAMLDQLSAGIAQFDAERKLVFANLPFRRIFGLPKAGSGHEFARLLSDARESGCTPEVRDFPQWRRERGEWFAATETIEEAWPLPGGTHLRVVAQPMPGGGLVMIAEDRTEQLKLSATRDTLLRTRTAMLDQLFEALAVFAPNGTLQLWNRSFAGVWGIDPEALEGHPSANRLVEIIAGNLAEATQAEALHAVIRAATLDRKRASGAADLADGRVVEFAAVPLPDGNGMLSVLDVTDSRRAEEALRQRNLALEQADKVKARFLANMSYELRSPLTSIGGFAELIRSGAAGPVNAQLDEYLEAILASVAKLTEQVDNVLDLSQSEAGLLPLSKRRLELLPFVTRLVREREPSIAERNLKLEVRGNAGGSIEADPRQLGRAIGQLLDNAIAACQPGATIRIKVERKDDGARVVIEDEGKGMGREELARALDGLRTNSDGTLERRQGLGIPLARRLIEEHGGHLRIESRKGEGTRVEIALP